VSGAKDVVADAGVLGNATAVNAYTYEAAMTLNVSNLNPTMTITPTGSSTIDTASFALGVATNNANGYELSIQAGCGVGVPGDVTLGTCASDNNLRLASNQSVTIAPTSLNTLSSNSWGYQFNVGSPTSNGWQVVPTVTTSLVSTSAPNAGFSASSTGTPDTYNVFFGANVSNAQTPGTYQGQVVWTAVAKP
jgi:hypothetical protein